MNRGILIPFGAVALATLTLAACVPPAPEPTPAPTQVARPEPIAPVVTQVPTPTYDSWMDAAQTPGDWRYIGSSGTSMTQATFASAGGPPKLTMSCDLATKQVRFAQPAAGSANAVQMRFRTETADRLMQARPEGALLVAQFPASDPFLDAIAFSKGRFAIETAGRDTMFVPAYPEISRIIEDCRSGRL